VGRFHARAEVSLHKRGEALDRCGESIGARPACADGTCAAPDFLPGLGPVEGELIASVSGRKECPHHLEERKGTRYPGPYTRMATFNVDLCHCVLLFKVRKFKCEDEQESDLAYGSSQAIRVNFRTAAD